MGDRSRFDFMTMAQPLAALGLAWMAGLFVFAGLLGLLLLYADAYLPDWMQQYSLQIFLFLALVGLFLNGWRPIIRLSKRVMSVIGLLIFIYFALFFLAELVLKIKFGVSATNSFEESVVLSKLLLMILIAPVLEEFFFRDVLLRSLYFHLGRPLYAIVLSSIFFMIAHMTIHPGAFLLGLISAGLFIVARSIWPSVIFHMLSNASWFFMPLWFPNLFKRLEAWNLLQYFYN